jgi:hypothetical protein
MNNVEGIRVDIYFGELIGSTHWLYSCNVQEDIVSPILHHETDAIEFLSGIRASFTRTDANTEDDMEDLLNSTFAYLCEMDKSKGFVIKVTNL